MDDHRGSQQIKITPAVPGKSVHYGQVSVVNTFLILLSETALRIMSVLFSQEREIQQRSWLSTANYISHGDNKVIAWFKKAI